MPAVPYVPNYGLMAIGLVSALLALFFGWWFNKPIRAFLSRMSVAVRDYLLKNWTGLFLLCALCCWKKPKEEKKADTSMDGELDDLGKTEREVVLDMEMADEEKRTVELAVLESAKMAY